MKIGETITFGSYYQSNDGTKEPVEWIVLETKEDSALIISKYVLDFKPYHRGMGVTWSRCNIRKWLNSEFKETVFNESERKLIKVSKITTNDLLFDKRGFIDDYSEDQKDEYEEMIYDECYDEIFLLSLDEAKKYFKSDDDRKGFPTPFAAKQHKYEIKTDNPCWWFLRTLGYERFLVSYVHSDGYATRSGTFMNSEAGIRPALWLNID